MHLTLSALAASLFLATALADVDEGVPVFDCKIPSFTEKLPTIALGKAALFPSGQLESIIKLASGGAKIDVREEGDSKYWWTGEILIGHVNKTSNESLVFPYLPSLKPGDLKINDGALKALVGDQSIIPQDKTRAGIVIGSRLTGSSQVVGKPPADPATYLLEGLIQRSIPYASGFHPVCGFGSQAAFDFDIDGNIRGLRHSWRIAADQNRFLTPLNTDQIQANITRRLMAAGIGSSATITSVDLCFYDANSHFLQPAFRFNATVKSDHGPEITFLEGFIPASSSGELEPLPTITTPSTTGPIPSNPDLTNSTTTQRRRRGRNLDFLLPGPSAQQRRQASSISVGRYLMSNDRLSPNFIDEASNLLRGLRGVSSRFVDSQYYWDDPYVYTASGSSRYINAVHLAFSDGHGSPHSFLTNGSKSDNGRVRISGDISAKGFGGTTATGTGSAGRLAYWILGECSVIPAPIDFPAGQGQKAFEPWWRVFEGGMHAVVGYRGLASVNPGKWREVGGVLGRGTSVVHGFMRTMLSTGKTAAVTRCGRDADSVFMTAGLGRPECLQIWWYK